MNYVAKGVKWALGIDGKKEAKTEDPGVRRMNYNDVNEGLNTILTNKQPLENKGDIHNKIISGEIPQDAEQGEPIIEPETSDTEGGQQKKEQEDNNDNNEEDNNDNNEEDNNDNNKEDNNDNNKEDKEEQKILKLEAEKKAQEYAEKSLKQMINGDNLLEGMQTFMQSIRDLPENVYEENIENYAIVLSNTTINGEKIFNDVEEAKQFINKIRNGAKTSKRYIKPRAYKQFKQEVQKQLQLTQMISRNVKHRTNAINVYQY